jgi:hypothetical protein
MSSSREEIFLIGHPKHQLTGSKLPSKGDCLRVFFYHMRYGKLNVKESARLVLQECALFWIKARIPTQELHKAAKKLTNLYEEWRSLLQTKERSTSHYTNLRASFREGLNDLFDIAIADALSNIKIEEDREFLCQQRKKGRPGSMLGADFVLAKKEERIRKRKEQEEIRKMKAQPSSSAAGKNIIYCNLLM